MDTTTNPIEKILEEKAIQIQKEQIDKRHEYNIMIMDIIKEYIDKYPNFRFIQLLWLLNIVNNMDRFQEESKLTYEKIKIAIQRMESMQTNINSTSREQQLELDLNMEKENENKI